jgi:D-serine deaminase-like pyridoxal phosphate-dependent protein
LLSETAAAVRRRDIVVHVLTGGGTGTSAIDAANGGLTEIQPGGYIFMDARYGEIEWDQGAPVPFEKSLTLLAGVISRPAPDRAILDMGYKAVSSDGGKPVPIEVPGAEFSFAGEEHGQLSYADGPCPLDIGDKVSFWPSHCDTTVNLYDLFIVTRGELVETVWPIAARGRVQ